MRHYPCAFPGIPKTPLCSILAPGFLVGIFLFLNACESIQQPTEAHIPEQQAIDSIKMNSLGLQLLKYGRAAVDSFRANNDLAYLNDGLKLLAQASDTLLLSGSYEKAYEAGRMEIGLLVPLGKHEEAIKRFEACRQYPLPDSSYEKAQIFNNAAAAYGELNYLKYSNALLDTAAQILQARSSLGLKHKFEPAMEYNVNLNRGLINLRLGQYASQAGLQEYGKSLYDTSEVRLLKAMELANDLPDFREGFRSYSIASAYNNYSLLLSAKGEGQLAVMHQKRAEAFRVPLQKDGTYEQNMGEIYLTNRAHKEAALQLSKAIKKIGNIYPDAPYFLVDPLLNLGKIYASRGQYGKAIEYYQQAIKQSCKDPLSHQRWTYPDPNEVHDPIEYIMVLEAMSKALKKQLDQQNSEDRLKFTRFYAAATKLMTDLHKVPYNDKVSYMLSTHGKSIIDDYLALDSLEGVEQAFQMVEQNRANFLFCNLGFREQTTSLVDSQNLVQFAAPGLVEIQSILAPDQLLLEYFWGEKQLLTFKISKNRAELLKQPIDSLSNLIQELQESLRTKPGISLKENIRFIKPAHALYQRLLAPALTGDSTIYKKIIVIPDAQIAHVAFHALLKSLPTDQRNFRNMAYAAKDHAISFAYSAKMWVYQQQRKPSDQIQSVLAVAPFTVQENSSVQFVSNGTKLKALSFSKNEVNAIQASNKTILLGQEANLQNFKEQAKHHSILHVGSHAQANGSFPDQSAVSFYPSADGSHTFSPEAISHFPLNHVEMVVLSACETAYGPIVAGEGTLSLARVFTMAGAHSVVASLWQVRDGATAELMRQFYRGLHQHQQKDMALRQAQLYLIEEGNRPLQAHPHYWAAFMQMGDIKPIDLGKSATFPNLWIMAFLVFFGLIGVWFWRRSSSFHALQ